MSKRVVITGMGVVSPIGSSLSEFHRSLLDIRSGIKYDKQLAELGFGCRVAGVPHVEESPYYSYLDKYSLSDASRIIQYGVVSALEAWLDAGFTIPEPNTGNTDYNTGCIIGSGIGSPDIFSEKIIPFTQERRIKYLKSSIVEKSMLSGVSANIGWILALGNQLSFNSSACATGLEAIANAYERIKHGQALRMLAGAAEADYIYTWAAFDAMRILNRRSNDYPQKASCPMSSESAGFVPGAGAGVLMLEEYTTALKRKATIYGEIAAVHYNSGGQRNGGSMTLPNSEGVIRCIKQTLQQAGINATDVDYINGHLSSTIADVIEIDNWANALQRYGSDFPLINSLKSLTGHCIGAAGAIETIAAVLQLKHQFVHGNINAEKLHPSIEEIVSREKIPTISIPKNFNTLIKASFGFGDVNVCAVIRKV